MHCNAGDTDCRTVKRADSRVSSVLDCLFLSCKTVFPTLVCRDMPWEYCSAAESYSVEVGWGLRVCPEDAGPEIWRLPPNEWNAARAKGYHYRAQVIKDCDLCLAHSLLFSFFLWAFILSKAKCCVMRSSQERPKSCWQWHEHTWKVLLPEQNLDRLWSLLTCWLEICRRSKPEDPARMYPDSWSSSNCEIMYACFFKPLNFGVICVAEIHN